MIKKEEIFKMQEALKCIFFEETDIIDLLNILSMYISQEIVIIDLKLKKKYSLDLSSDFNKYVRDNSIENINEKYSTYCIEYNNKKYAYIIIDQNVENAIDLDDTLLKLIEFPILLLLQKESQNFYIQKKYRDEFIQDLLFNKERNIVELEKKAKTYGWNLSDFSDLVVLLISTGDTIDERGYNHIEFNCKDEIKRLYPNSIYTIFENKLIFIVSGVNEEKAIKKLLNDLLDSIGDDIFISVGSKKDNILMSDISYNEAIIAQNVGKKISDERICFYDDLGAYKLLASVHNSVIAKDFMQTYLNPLKIYDQEQKQDLLSTLDALVLNDWDIASVAKEQYVHYNTVKYRINKISDILGLELNNADNKINIALALKLYRLTA